MSLALFISRVSELLCDLLGDVYGRLTDKTTSPLDWTV
jgi:hypothetical protein